MTVKKDYGRKPDLKLRVATRNAPRRSGEIGAGWINGDGSISIRLSPGTSVAHRDGLYITPFPVRKKESCVDPKKHGCGLPKKTESDAEKTWDHENWCDCSCHADDRTDEETPGVDT